MLESLKSSCRPSGPLLTPIQVFSSEYCKIYRTSYFEEHLRTAASELTLGSDCLKL